MGLVYLTCLLVSLGCMALMDRRWRLFVWRDRRRALVVLAVGVGFFLVWDVVGIATGIFFRGHGSHLMTGVLIGPELPLEEVFFLVLLCWSTMLAVAGAHRVLTGDRRAAASEAVRR
ncbi:lycopene cyclase domain-containing protein [Cellulomonas oligotrophica]|uniref:Lycopene cyclase n=1 Tax=Cellulomonas oligotrophica TaxID=931536 RepID=A0A7Y9JWJ5_9CELL|nr:lycopene cyclase domain-containing protein [Cellulomonas oligotrophica]NYD85728.1 lycopene cyclase domain-containing protein [Cellulomonas oligotrophica]GIG31265.1 lycopene cyclase [Cellulomonas oligotrophica]